MSAFRIIVVLILMTPLAITGFMIYRDGFNLAVAWPLGLMVIVAVGLFYLVRWHAAHHQYRCDYCENVFGVSAGTDFFSPHFPGRKRLACPKCSEITWCEELDQKSPMADAKESEKTPVRRG